MTKTDNEIYNFYNHSGVKKLLPAPIKNPTFDQTQITVPSRIGIIAPSGSDSENCQPVVIIELQFDPEKTLLNVIAEKENEGMGCEILPS